MKVVHTLGVLIVVAVGGYWLGQSRTGPDHTLAANSAVTSGPNNLGSPVVPSDPIVGFSPAQIDLGQQPWGRSVLFELTFVNGSDREVGISGVETSCGCLVLDGDSYTGASVAPHTSLTIAVRLDVERTPGPIRRLVQLTTNEGTPPFTANVDVDVVPTYSFSPDSVDFGHVDLESPEPGPTALVAFASESFELDGEAVTDCDWFSADVVWQDDGTAALRLRVLSNRLPSGRSAGIVTIRTTDPLVPRAVLPVRVRGIQALAPVPRRVLLVGG
jgi:hypothetical protein